MKKNIFISVALILFLLVLGIFTALCLVNNSPSANNTIPNENETNNENPYQLPVVGNDYIIKTNSDTSLRVINEYTTEFFDSDKNLLIMFGSWCSHCAEELKDVEKIVEYYKENKNVNVILIAHEYKETISDLTNLVEKDFNFGNTQVFIDLKRIIRKTIDPEASTVPISYIVDKNGKVIEKNDGAITLDIAKDMLK